MQVTHVQDHVTHAVIGGQKAREAQISNSAEFFNVLSNTLYSDKILAVVREVLCNAWDIHIESGKTGTPVEVTLKDGKLTIRDFGTGIHDDDMVIVYGTYGNSTKKLDGTQTGGFGLGSKAPWAYVDHFEVISYHQGRKTIYAMSKSSGEVAGKPSIMPIVSVPTTETGLSVSFKVAPEDLQRFRRVIEMITRFGEMNVKLNEVSLKTLPFSKAENGFMIVPQVTMHEVAGGNTHTVFVRYGNVVYPIPNNEKLRQSIGTIREFLLRIQGASDRYGYRSASEAFSIIFQAKPNSISVTPSRESLSMTDHTIKSIEELFTSFFTLKDEKLQKLCFELLQECIAKTWAEKKTGKLLTSDNEIPGLKKITNTGSADLPSVMTNFDQITKRYASAKYPSFDNFRKKDVQSRLDLLIKNGFGNKGKIQTFRREYEKTGNAPSTWFQREITVPLIKKISNEEHLSIDKLFAFGENIERKLNNWGDINNNKLTRKTKTGYYTNNVFTPIMKFSKRNLEEYLPFLRNIVIIAFNREAVDDRADTFPIMKDELGLSVDTLVYLTPRHSTKSQAAVDFFTKLGFTVLDLTKAQPWEPQEIVEVIKVEVKKPRKKGIPKLNAIFDGINIKPHLMRSEEATIPRLEKPEFVIKISGSDMKSSELRHFDDTAQRDFIYLYGDVGGVAVNENQKDRFVGLGSKEVMPFLWEKLTLELQTNPGIAAHYGSRINKIPDVFQPSIAHRTVFKAIRDTPELAKLFGIKIEKKADDERLIRLIQSLRTGYGYRHSNEITEINKLVAAFDPNPEVIALAKKMNKSKIIGVLDATMLTALFSSKNVTAEQKGSVIDILLYAIEG